MNDNDFDSIMGTIDRDMAKAGVPISARQLRGMMEFSKRTQSQFLMDSELGIRINNWFKSRYGDALCRDFRIGTTVIELLGELWQLRLPVVFGQLVFNVSRRPRVMSQSMNVLDLVESMDLRRPFPDVTRRHLSDGDLQHTGEVFHRAYHAFVDLGSDRSPLVASAKQDFNSAVTCMARPAHWGQAKWASLQAVEKLMKAALEAKVGSYPKTHDLAKLSVTLTQNRLAAPSAALISCIQCDAGVRYDIPVSKTEAIAAHYAALEIAQILAPVCQ